MLGRKDIFHCRPKVTISAEVSRNFFSYSLATSLMSQVPCALPRNYVVTDKMKKTSTTNEKKFAMLTFIEVSNLNLVLTTYDVDIRRRF